MHQTASQTDTAPDTQALGQVTENGIEHTAAIKGDVLIRIAWPVRPIMSPNQIDPDP